MKMKKSSNISATALHRFIPQPASGRSSALPCLAANIVLSKLLWEIHLHGLKFIPEKAFEIYPDVKFVVLVHLYGTPAKLDEIMAVCKKHGAVLVEDAAESFGATYKGKQTGTFLLQEAAMDITDHLHSFSNPLISFCLFSRSFF